MPVAPLPWEGFHHVALVTPDLARTRAFYGDVLGMDIGDVLVGGGVIPARHCFIRPGHDVATWGLHFFEHRDALISTPPGGVTGLREAGFIVGALQHVAFALPDAAAADALRARLAAAGVETTPIGRVGPLSNVLFLDPNGVLLEATWPNSPGPR